MFKKKVFYFIFKPEIFEMIHTTENEDIQYCLNRGEVIFDNTVKFESEFISSLFYSTLVFDLKLSEGTDFLMIVCISS